MPSNTRKQKRQQRRQKIKSGLKSVASHALPAVKSAVQAILPGLLNQISSKAGQAIGGLPFRTSGMMASATPMSIGSGIQVSAPSANGKITHTGAPSMKSSSNGDVRISHREYVADLAVEQAGFDLQYKFGVNPGNAGLFPWLSQIAQRYEMYKFQKLHVIYEPQCGTSSTGTLMLAIDYDSSDPPPSSKQQMMSYKNAARSPLWFAADYAASSPDLHRLKTNYILSGVAPADTDIKTYDIGNLFVAIQSDGGTLTAGELYVEYVVDLVNPQISGDANSATIYAQRIGAGVPINPFIDPTAHTLNGSLPVVVQVDDTQPDQADLYVQGVGWYLVSGQAYLDAANPSTGIPFLNVSCPQNPTGDVAFYSNLIMPSGTPDKAFVGFQNFMFVQNPEEVCLSILWDEEQMTEPYAQTQIYLSIASCSSSSVVDFTGDPLSTLSDPRARLGRLKPFPPVPVTALARHPSQNKRRVVPRPTTQFSRSRVPRSIFALDRE